MGLRETIERMPAKEPLPDLAERLGIWLPLVEGFFGDVEGWLGAYAPNVVVERTPIVVDEGEGDIYKAERLDVRIARLTIEFVPAASSVIGGFGRIDMTIRGMRDTVVFMPVSPDRSWIHLDREARNPLVPLTRQVFEDRLEGLIDAALNVGLGSDRVPQGRTRVVLDLDDREMEALDALCVAKEVSRQGVLRQALRLYQSTDRRLADGETKSFWLSGFHRGVTHTGILTSRSAARPPTPPRFRFGASFRPRFLRAA